MNLAFQAQPDGSVRISAEESGIAAIIVIPGQDSDRLLAGLAEEFRKAKAIAGALTPVVEALVTKGNGKGKRR